MDSPRPILPTELEFFSKGTGKGTVSPDLFIFSWLWLGFSSYIVFVSHVLTDNLHFTVPLVVVFTKFDGQIINEYVNLPDLEIENKWGKARENADAIFQTIYLPKVLNTQYPPKGYVQLEGNNDKIDS